MKLPICPSVSPPSTDLYIGRGLLCGDLLSQLCGEAPVAILADDSIRELYAKPLASRLGAYLLAIPSGERAKRYEMVKPLIEELLAKGCGRDTVLIAIGGGAATDLAGFVASIYLRGLPLILIPTTLLGMVDASIGGKNALNFPQGKNILGTVYPPKAILADLDTLDTLPEIELRNGLAEIVKIGLVFDASILEETDLEQQIIKAAKAKISVIEQDPTDQGLRRILNYGHTIAHGLEAISDYQMPHGQAVAIGCAVESYLSLCLGYLSQRDFDRTPPIPINLPQQYTRQALLQAMSRDKKASRGIPRFVLIDRIGHAVPFDGEYCRTVSEEELRPALEWMEGH